MKKILFGCAAIVASQIFAAPSVENVLVHQRWPWSTKVDIDFTLDANADVEITATWNQCPAPRDLTGEVVGQTMALPAGSHHLEWDPVAAGITSELIGFTVNVKAIDGLVERKYLVVDLYDNTYEYLSEIPAGGWTDEYKWKKMAFRRIPAGTMDLGVDASDFERLGMTEDWMKTRNQKHKVTISHDFYLGIYEVHAMQYWQINAGVNAQTFTSYASRSDLHYAQGSISTCIDEYMRTKSTVDKTVDASISWPASGFAVKSDSWFGNLRAKYGNKFRFDFPTLAQWQYACRGGEGAANSDSIWYCVSHAEFLSMTDAQVAAKLDEIAKWNNNANNAEVGQKVANALGLYDMLGNVKESALDFYSNNAYGGTDPVGPTSGSRRVQCGGTISMSRIVDVSTECIANDTATIGGRVAIQLYDFTGK